MPTINFISMAILKPTIVNRKSHGMTYKEDWSRHSFPPYYSSLKYIQTFFLTISQMISNYNLTVMLNYHPAIQAPLTRSMQKVGGNAFLYIFN